jgi:hypothetical protein
MAEIGGNTMTELAASLAYHDDGFGIDAANPGRDIGMGAPDRARHQAWIEREVLLRAHVDNDGSPRCPDEAAELFR